MEVLSSWNISFQVVAVAHFVINFQFNLIRNQSKVLKNLELSSAYFIIVEQPRELDALHQHVKTLLNIPGLQADISNSEKYQKLVPVVVSVIAELEHLLIDSEGEVVLTEALQGGDHKEKELENRLHHIQFDTKQHDGRET